jgi:hypothetical protein
MDASVAAETVPEYRTFIPTLAPLFIPEITKSGCLGKIEYSANLTESAGVPLIQ